MYNKKLTLILIVLLCTSNFACNCKDTICDVVDYAADLLIENFLIDVDIPIVGNPTGTTMIIKNFIYDKVCEDETTFQREAGSSYSEFDLFFREDASDAWQAVNTSGAILVNALTAGSSEPVGDEVTFNVEGEYYLRAKADVGNVVIEEDETNNERNNDDGVIDLRSSDIKFIRVITDENTDIELMRRKKSQGKYATFKSQSKYVTFK